MAQWRSRTLRQTVRLLRARRSRQGYMPGTHRLVGSRGAKIGEAVRKNAQVDSGSQSSLSGSLGSLVGRAPCPPVDRPLDGRRRASASLVRQGELIAAVAPASGVDASAPSETCCAPASDDSRQSTQSPARSRIRCEAVARMLSARCASGRETLVLDRARSRRPVPSGFSQTTFFPEKCG